MIEFPTALELMPDPRAAQVSAYLAVLQQSVDTASPFTLQIEASEWLSPFACRAFLAARIPGKYSHRFGVWAEFLVAPSGTNLGAVTFRKLMAGVVPNPNPTGQGLLAAGALVVDLRTSCYTTEENSPSAVKPIPGFPLEWWRELRATVVALTLLHALPIPSPS